MLPLKSWVSVKNCIALIVTLVVFSLLIKLCTWQWGRGVEKQAMEALLEAHGQNEYQALSALNDAQIISSNTEITGTKVKTTLTPTGQPILLLDNQTVDKKVGYLVYQIMAADSGNKMLVDLGFVQATSSRERLPSFQILNEEVTLTGKLYTKSNGVFSQALMSDGDDPIRIQNLNISELEQRFQIRLAPYILQPDSLESWPQTWVWKPLNMSSAKHFGYSFQWFVMAMVFASLCLRYRKVLFSKSKFQNTN